MTSAQSQPPPLSTPALTLYADGRFTRQADSGVLRWHLAQMLLHDVRCNDGSVEVKVDTVSSFIAEAATNASWLVIMCLEQGRWCVN